MNHDPVAKDDRLSGIDCEAAVFSLVSRKVPYTENICSEQAIRARMPIGRVARIRGVVHDRDADRLAVNGPEVVYPRGSLSPDIFFALAALGVYHFAVSIFRQSSCESNPEGAFF